MTRHHGIARGTADYRALTWAMLLAGLATFALLYTAQPLLPLFTAEYGVSAEVASLAVSLTTGPMAIALVPAGILSDRLGRRPLMIASLLTAAVLTIVAAVLPGAVATPPGATVSRSAGAAGVRVSTSDCRRPEACRPVSGAVAVDGALSASWRR